MLEILPVLSHTNHTRSKARAILLMVPQGARGCVLPPLQVSHHGFKWGIAHFLNKLLPGNIFLTATLQHLENSRGFFCFQTTLTEHSLIWIPAAVIIHLFMCIWHRWASSPQTAVTKNQPFKQTTVPSLACCPWFQKTAQKTQLVRKCVQVQESEKQLPFHKAPAAFILHFTDGFLPNLTQGIHTSYCLLGKHIFFYLLCM